MTNRKFDDLSEDERLVLIEKAFLHLCEDNSVPYGIQTGDDGCWDEYLPAIELATDWYENE